MFSTPTGSASTASQLKHWNIVSYKERQTISAVKFDSCALTTFQSYYRIYCIYRKALLPHETLHWLRVCIVAHLHAH